MADNQMTFGTRNAGTVILVSLVFVMADDRMTLRTQNEVKVILVSSVLAMADDRMTLGTGNKDVIFSLLRISSGKRSDDTRTTK